MERNNNLSEEKKQSKGSKDGPFKETSNDLNTFIIIGMS